MQGNNGTLAKIGSRVGVLKRAVLRDTFSGADIAVSSARNLARHALPGWARRHDPYDIAATVLLATLAALVLLTFDAYAISNDEEVQQRYGEFIVAYYQSGFSDLTLFNYRNLYLYGGLFDIVAVLIAKVLPFPLYAIRHVLCGATGVAGIAATWATARIIAGPRAGLIAAAALAVCGVWYGGMFNHTKDIPFAAAMIGGTYFLLRAAGKLPQPRVRDLLGLGLCMGAALGLRALGLLLPVYLALAVLMIFASRTTSDRHARLAFAGRSFLAFVPALILAYLIMIAAWPWASLNIVNPARAIFAFSHFQYPIRTIFDGHVYDMSHVPRWYVPAYLAIKLPLVTIAGAILAIAFALAAKPAGLASAPQLRREIALVSFTAIFPVLCHVAGRGPAFTGMRHFLFVVPPFAVLAGIGCNVLLQQLGRWRAWAATATAAVLTAALAWDATVLTRLHPYEYLAYNSLVGGFQGTGRQYEADYWVNIMPEAVRDLESYIARTDSARPPAGRPAYSVGVCAERLPFEQLANRGLQWTPDWDRADFFISPTHMNCDHALDGTIVARIERMGTLIGVVKDRRAITRPEFAARN